jgi:hypothetical protein
MAPHTVTGTTIGGTLIPPELRLSHDLNDALTTWSTSQRTVIGLAADFADSGEWMATGAVSAAHWIARVADIEVCTAREWIRVGRRLRTLPPLIAGVLISQLTIHTRPRARRRASLCVARRSTGASSRRGHRRPVHYVGPRGRLLSFSPNDQ